MERNQLKKGVWDKDIDRHPLFHYTFTTRCGYEGEIKRNYQWAYCGYVVLPDGHPDSRAKYSSLASDIKVHGGLTFGGGDGMFGFDCVNSGDLTPFDVTFGYTLFPDEKHYWTFEEVKQEIEKMADQFKLRESN